MRTNLLNGLSNVVKKGTSLACSWSQVGRMSEEGAIEHPLSTLSAPFGTRWKPAGNKAITSFNPLRLAAMVTLLLTLACGNVWATDQTYTISTPTAARNVSGNVLITGTVASKKVKSTSSTACFYVASGSNAPVTIASKSANIKSITIKGNRDTGSSDNTIAAFNVLTSSDLATFTTPTKGFTATKDNNGSSSSVASLSSIPMVGNNQSYVTEVTISFDSPVMGIELTYSSSTSFSYISVTYDDAITAPSVLCEAHATSTTAYGGTGCTVTTDGVQSGVTISSTYYYNKLSGDAKYIKLDLGSGKSFAVGDEIWIECNGNGVYSEGAKLNSSASATGATAAVSVPTIGSGMPMWVRCVTVAASPWKAQQSLYVLRNSSNSRIYQVEVRRPAGKAYTVSTAVYGGVGGTVSAGASSLDKDETTTITATPAAGYQVTNWAVSGEGASISPSGASNSNTTTLTMGTANATVTATFGPKSYTVTLNDQSATTAGTENVTTTYNSNTNLTSAITKPTKTGYVFAGYFTAANGGGVQLIDPAGNWIASAGGGSTYMDGSKNWKNDGDLTLYACWMEYASTFDIKAYVQSNLSSGSTTKTFTILGTNKLLYSLSGNTELDNSSDASNAYDGLKFKNSGDYILFLVQANSSLKLYFGYTDTKPKISINGGAESNVDVSSTGSKTADQEVDFGSETYDRLIKIRTVTSNAVVLQKISITSSCTAPNHVDISGAWDKFGGETISLTATAYSSAGTGSPIADANITGWQWQKYVNSAWSNVSDGTDAGATISGATTKNLQISNCHKNNSGSYRCVVSTGATCSTASNGRQIKVYVLECYNSGTTVYNFTRDGENQRGSLTIDLAASTNYGFKVHADNDYYGNNGTVYEDVTNWVCSTDQAGNLTIAGGLGGTFTITMDYSGSVGAAAEGIPEVSVTYPRKTVYLKPNSNWKSDGGKFAFYYYRKVGETTYGTGWTDFLSASVCDGDVYPATIPQWSGVKIIGVRFNSTKTSTGNWDDKWNQTDDLTLTSNDLVEITGWSNSQNYNSTYDAPEYTISFAGNGNTGGSMTDVDDIACDASVTLEANAFVKTGYSFAGWKDASSNDYADEATINNIRANIALTAQWTEDKHSVTVAAGSNGTVSPSSVSNIGIATASGDITATANTGYHFTSWTLPSGTSAASTYSETSNPIHINATADGKTITANFSANTPTITLDDQDATNTPTGSVVATYGSSMPEIATLPTKTGYTFGGFYSDVAGGGTKYYNADGSSAKNSDLASATTLYALWTQSVTIDDNGGSADGSVTVTYNGTAGTPSVPTYAGHTVDLGYYAESSCTNKVMALDGTLQTSVTDGSSVAWTNSSSKWAHAGSSTLYAHWKCNTPEISCSSNTITISVPSGATVYYTTTTDGSTPADPTSSSTAYNPSSKPTISADTKIKAIAIQSGCTNSAIASASLTYVAPGPSYTAPTSALDVSAQTSVTAAALITANNATQSYYLSTNTDTLLLIPSDIYYNIGNGKKNTWAKFDGSSSTSAANWTCPAGSVSFKGRTWWKSGGNINTLEVRSDRSLNIRVKGCKTVSVLSSANTADTRYFIMEAYEYDDGYKSSDPDVSANNKSTSVTETSLSLNSSKEYVVVLRGNTEDKNKVYEIKFIAPSSGYTVSITANPDGYGTVSSSSVTSVASGTTLSASTNTLSVGATNVTASATSATAEYTYAFSNWAKSDGTALPSTVTADLSVYANFTRSANSYTLTWNTNGGSDLDCDGCTSGSTAYGADITAPNDPTLSNYTFDGWKTNNDGTGTTAGSTMPAANTTYYAAWKQTVTLTTGAQGEGGNQTPYVYLNGTGVSSFTAHTASGYSLQGYYTAGSGGTKVLNADGTFAAANVTDYITSSKWSRTGAAPTLYAQWVASEDCHTLKYAWKVTGKFCDDESTSVTSSDTVRFPANASNLYFTESGTGNTVSAGSSYNIGKTKDNYFLLTAKSGYQIKSICFYGKVQDSSVDYTTDNSTWTELESTKTDGDDYYSFSSIDASYFGIKLTAASPKGIWIRNMVIEICAAGGVTYNVTYNGNDATGGTAPTDNTDYDYGGTVTVKGNTGSLAKTNYTFAGWSTNDDGTGSNYVADNTFSITEDITLYAKWTQAITFDANTSNHGSTGGSATAVWNATGLTGITHATPASGYKLLGYYTTASGDGTKVLNSDGTFADTDVTNYITSGKWSRTGTAPTLYARYEAAGALTWNLSVNTDATSLTTSSKSSAFTEISTTNMSNATLAGELTYEKAKKSSLTGKISTPASYDADDYVYVTFQVASGYKFTPSSIKVIAQPVTTGKDVKLSLTDGASHSLVSSSATSISGGSTQTVTLAGDGTYFKGTVTLKIYCYGATDKYRLGTPITIEGEVEAECETMPSFTRLSYGKTSYTVGVTPDNLEVIGGTNISTYLWKQNTTNDRSGGEAASGTNNTATYTPPTTSAGTMYYWCEMTNTDCGITIKTSAVGITVNEDRDDATVTWTNPASTPNYGGSGYTIKATVNETTWAGAPEDLTLSAPEGIRIYNVTRGTTSSQDWIQANFDVQTTFDRTSYSSKIPFVVSADAKTGWNAISDQKDVSYSSCTGAGEGTSYNIRMRKTVTKDGNYYHCANTDGWISPNISSSYSTSVAGTTMEDVFDTVASSNTQYVWVRTYHANVSKVRIYADFRANDMTVSNVYKHTAYFTADSKYAVEYAAVYNGDEENSNTGTAAQGYVDIILEELMAANDILLVKFNDNKVRPLGAVITESSAGSLETALVWSETVDDGANKKNKTTNDVNFTITASPTGVNSNTLGIVTYSSNHPEYASVNRTTGEVTLVAAGTAQITATLAASGCYQSATKTYTIVVTEPECDEPAGTIEVTSGSTEICSDAIELTFTHVAGATVQWYNGETAISNGGSYSITAPSSTTSVLTTTTPGNYSAKAYTSCPLANAKRSNTIKVVSQSTEVSAERIVDSWYIKHGRTTPDIELWSVSEGATLGGVSWSPSNATGLNCELRDGIVYLEGKEPSTNESGDDIVYTLTLTINDVCGGDHEIDETITITHQKNTDKHVLAFVVVGKDKGGFTEGLTAAQTTDVGLYKTIAANFDVQATNCYSTDDEQKVKQYYSQFDILCITDYPNSNTKGVNGKKYVDVLGKLIDIRPILTMEAFVSDKDNWKAKGISGNPKDPTTRQYTMLLQCKDHEIFAGTELTKVGEGDETMYRVSMVDNTKEDYATLDATYGEGEHAEKTGYAYHTYPALQGFTFSSEMLSDGLLPLGLIDDGAGNDLQVGIERQTEMSARLMVLGINSYAMERLTNDGQTVVINALKYLLKKNEEEIADCSIAFYGGAEGDATNWDNDENWKGGVKPDKTAREIRILAPVVITTGQKIHAQAPIKIASSGTYNGGTDNAEGKITIEAGGALIVDGEIKAVTAPAYSKTRATAETDLILNTSGSAQSALILNNDDGDTKATVKLYSLGRKEGSYKYQYIAIPMEYVAVNPTFANEAHGGTKILTYVYTEAGGWERRGYYNDLYAFEGVGITTNTTANHMDYTMTGTLASTTTKEITLTNNNDGYNMMGNSWTAPIQIDKLAEDNTDDNLVQTVYVYCTGNDGGTGATSSEGVESEGQWIPIPFETSGTSGWRDAGKLSVIPAMQAYQLKANAETTLTLDYNKVVRGSTNSLTEKLRAPKRRNANSDVPMTIIRVKDSKTYTDVCLLEGEQFSDEFDNGWEAEYMTGDGPSATLYAETEIGRMAVAALPELEGMVLGFAPGKELEYTFTFIGSNMGYYLNDLKLKQSTPISEDESYMFTFEEGDTNRFYISKTPINAPSVATGTENTGDGVKARKVLVNDKLYIILNGRVYSAEGVMVK